MGRGEAEKGAPGGGGGGRVKWGRVGEFGWG